MTPLVGDVLYLLPHDTTIVRVVVLAGIVYVGVRAMPLRPRRVSGAVLMLLSLGLFRTATRTLPEDSPIRIWALSSTSSFPFGWRDLRSLAALPAPTPAD